MDALVNRWGNGLQPFLSRPFNDFLETHPLWAWGLDHPLWMVAIATLALLLLAGLWSAIARLTENFWLTLVQLPFRLGRWGLRGLSRLLHRPAQPALAKSSNHSAPERLTEILQRLEALQQEQEALVQEMRSLLTQQSQK
ncbi:MAG: hypothetical protein ICV62_08460 [Cyanobacteria bacterium Co-bin13]|nr:hypothetical protein [Cyanobacteria bacterium Co-bin13]